eukprot:12924409-Prorocentrum_lima.AAC.1
MVLSRGVIVRTREIAWCSYFPEVRVGLQWGVPGRKTRTSARLSKLSEGKYLVQDVAEWVHTSN